MEKDRYPSFASFKCFKGTKNSLAIGILQRSSKKTPFVVSLAKVDGKEEMKIHKLGSMDLVNNEVFSKLVFYLFQDR